MASKKAKNFGKLEADRELPRDLKLPIKPTTPW